MKIYLAVLTLCLLSAQTFAVEENLDEPTQSVEANSSSSRVLRGNYPQIYSSSLHDEMSIKDKYIEGGVYYLRGETNSFGEDEAVNTQQEIILCSNGDKTFTEVAKSSMSKVLFADHDGKVIKDSASIGVLPNQFIADLEEGLTNNANNNTKGRFCYKVNNPDVNYKTVGAENASFCAKGSSTGIFEDPVTRNRCELILDIDLKAGESRYLRQPQGNFRTISQGFVRCANEGLGQPELELISNPSNCGANNASACNFSCIWADNSACSGSVMPRWGGGACGGVGATIFLNDVINIEASRALSFDFQNGTQYEGSAQMNCQSVGETAVWVIVSSNCTEVDE